MSKNTQKEIRKRFIYHLLNPTSNQVFYVGQTVDPVQRLNEHVKNLGFIPVMRTVKAVTGTFQEAYHAEVEEILSFPAGQLTNKVYLQKGSWRNR